MSDAFVITGTDTGIGKTVFAAALVGALDGSYWKPVQAVLDGETDSDAVRRLSGLSPDRVLPEAYRLAMPASPHIAAAREGIEIDPKRLALPCSERPLIVEGAGGAMVPLSAELLQIDQFAAWRKPVIVCARTELGTINHTLLTIEALRRREVTLHGVAFIGGPETEVEATIVSLGQVQRLGRLQHVEPLLADTLAAAFREGFDIRDFTGEGSDR
jgi:dethiobiotin synthetase